MNQNLQTIVAMIQSEKVISISFLCSQKGHKIDGLPFWHALAVIQRHPICRCGYCSPQLAVWLAQGVRSSGFFSDDE